MTHTQIEERIKELRAERSAQPVMILKQEIDLQIVGLYQLRDQTHPDGRACVCGALAAGGDCMCYEDD